MYWNTHSCVSYDTTTADVLCTWCVQGVFCFSHFFFRFSFHVEVVCSQVNFFSYKNYFRFFVQLICTFLTLLLSHFLTLFFVVYRKNTRRRLPTWTWRASSCKILTQFLMSGTQTLRFLSRTSSFWSGRVILTHNKVQDVTTHFRAEWCNERLGNWSCGHSHNSVMNTNGLEGTNKVIKDELTFRQLMSVLDFLQKARGTRRRT